ncbi:MAG: DnaD domain protein [Caldilineae bacterium]|nr:MAG: DnaD domain protein [Caldilineae bacterium]
MSEDEVKTFPGFTAGRTRFAHLPEAFFTQVLGVVDDLAELKAILYTFWRLSQGRGDVRYLRLTDALLDLQFLDTLTPVREQQEACAREAFRRAVQHGVLLEIDVQHQGKGERWFFLNSPKGREALARIRAGDYEGLAHRPDEILQATPQPRPNIFRLYEQYVGVITASISEELRQAERDFPEDWLRDAFQLAVAKGKPHWPYIRAILNNWAKNGKENSPQD